MPKLYGKEMKVKAEEQEGSHTKCQILQHVVAKFDQQEDNYPRLRVMIKFC